MQHALPAIASQFFQPEPHVAPPALVAIVKRAVRRPAPDLLRDCVQQRPRLAFRLLAVLNIDRYSVPVNDVSLRVSQRHGANWEPTILPVSSAETCLLLKGIPVRQSRSPFVC